MTAGKSVKGNIQLGDLIQAMSELGWGHGHAHEIAACLGFDISQIPEKKKSHEIGDPRLRDKQEQKRIKPVAVRSPRAPVMPSQPDIPPPLPAIKSANQRLQKRTETAPSARLDAKWQAASTELLVEETRPSLPRTNLFPERVSRHLFTAALNTKRVSRNIDIPRLIDRVCHEPLIIDIPYTLETTLDAGCHLLRDFSHSMTPYHDDLYSLERQVREVVGLTRLHTFNFNAKPQKPMRWLPTGKRDFWYPDGRPVLVATDFGILSLEEKPRLDSQWHGFIQRCQQAGSPLVFLSPWPDKYTPRDLGGYASLLHWSPRTTVAMIQRSLAGRGR